MCPSIEESHSPAQVRLLLPLPAGGMGRASRRRLGEQQRMALEAAREGGGVTSSRLATLSGRSERSAQRTLKSLLDMGLVDRERRDGRWVYTAR